MDFSLVNLLLILTIAWVAGYLVSRLGYPPVLGELAAGIIFGPPLLGIIEADDGTLVLGKLGVLLMMLFIGMSINLQDLLKSFRSALLCTVSGFLLPFAMGYLVMLALGYNSGEGMLVGCIITVTALAVVPRIVMDLGILYTRPGQTLVAVSLISVGLFLTAFAVVKNIVELGTLDLAGLALVILKVAVFLGLTIVTGWKLFPYIRPVMQRLGVKTRTPYFALFVLIGLAFSALAEAAGLVFILGAFMAGLFLDPEMAEPGFFTDVMEAKRDVAVGVLAPVFFVSAGFAVSLDIFTEDPILLLLILLAAFLGKILGGLFSYLLSRQNWREGLVIGLGMNGRGGVDIVAAGIALAGGLISENIFTAIIFTIFLTTLSVPIFLKAGASWLQKRDELIPAGNTP